MSRDARGPKAGCFASCRVQSSPTAVRRPRRTTSCGGSKRTRGLLVAAAPFSRTWSSARGGRELENTTQLYPDYLEGKKSGSEVPFDTNSKRYENGQVTAAGLPSFQLQSWGFVVTRRMLVSDSRTSA
jgi:hypothetical protein